jgi:WD40 repeat protein
VKRDDDPHADTLASTDPTIAATVGDTIAAPGRDSAQPLPARTTNFVPERELARGGMGRVVIAKDRRLDRTVALKLLQRDSPGLRARFEREAAITARLAHPAIVPIYEAGELGNGEPFYAMKLVEGTPLDATIEAAGELRERLALLPRAMAVCEALAYAHSRRVIHRDLKPANVLVGAYGETVVIDWGIAKDLTQRESMISIEPSSVATADMTVDGEVVGTPSYMPPEQATGGTVDERADVYALGALLYHIVAGRPPYRGRTAGEILAAVEAAPPKPIADVEPDVPDDLASIIGKAMARTPGDRYPSAGELAAELRRFIDGRLVESHRYSGAELLARWVRKHRAPIGVAAVAVVVLAIGGVIAVRKIVARERETARALAESELEQGRQLLVAGAPGQATPYLIAAMAALPDDPLAHRLAARALRDAHRRIAAFDATASAFRPDGRELALAGTQIAIVDPATGSTLRSLPAPDAGKVAQLAYSPDGAQLAIAGARGAFVIDAGTGALIATRGEPASEIAFVPPRGELIAILGPTSIALVDRAGKLVAVDRELVATKDLELAPDGSAIGALAGGAAFAWSVPELARVTAAPIAGGRDRYSIVVEAGGGLVTAGQDGVRRWRGLGPAELAPLVDSEKATLERFPDGSLLTDGLTFDAAGEPHEFTRVPIQVGAVVDATHVITGGYDRTLRVWDLARTAAPAIVLDAEAATATLAVDSTGRRAATRADRDAAKVELWDISQPPAPQKMLATGARIAWIITDRHDRIAIRSGDSTRLVSTALEPVATLPGWPVEFRPGHDELVTDVAGRLDVFSAKTGARVREIADQPELWHAAFSHDGSAIATSSARHVSLRDADWRVVASFDTPTIIAAIAVDDAGHIVTGETDGTIHVWDARSGSAIATAHGHEANVSQLALVGDTLISSGWDITTRRWRYPSLAPIDVEHFDRIVAGIAVSPSGTLLAVADNTNAAQLWDPTRGRIIDLVPAMDPLTAIAFVDDDHVVVGGDGGHVELFDLAPPATSAEELRRLAAGLPRWRLDHGHAIETAQP